MRIGKPNFSPLLIGEPRAAAGLESGRYHGALFQSPSDRGAARGTKTNRHKEAEIHFSPLLIGEPRAAYRHGVGSAPRIWVFQSPSDRGAARGFTPPPCPVPRKIDFSPLLIGEPRAARKHFCAGNVSLRISVPF